MENVLALLNQTRFIVISKTFAQNLIELFYFQISVQNITLDQDMNWWKIQQWLIIANINTNALRWRDQTPDDCFVDSKSFWSKQESSQMVLSRVTLEKVTFQIIQVQKLHKLALTNG